MAMIRVAGIFTQNPENMGVKRVACPAVRPVASALVTGPKRWQTAEHTAVIIISLLSVPRWNTGCALERPRTGVSALHDACHSQKRSRAWLGRKARGGCPPHESVQRYLIFAGRSICRCGPPKDRGGEFRRRALRRGICGCRIWGLILFGRGRGVHGSSVGLAYS
jgi:hypothetical protein